jgi:hypothetical protein
MFIAQKNCGKNIVLAALERGCPHMPPSLDRMLDSSADLGGAPCSQSDLGVYPELQIDSAYSRSLSIRNVAKLIRCRRISLKRDNHPIHSSAHS